MHEHFLDAAFSFSKAAHGHMNLTTNFKVGEFAPQDGTDPIIINPLIPLICQIVRNWFGYPYAPNSAYRTVAHNKSVKGAATSFHIYGKAVDIPAKGSVTPKDLYDFLDRLFGNCMELGLYDWGVHVGICLKKKRYTDKKYGQP